MLERVPPNRSCGPRLNNHGSLIFPARLPFWFFKSRSNGLDHPPEPVEIQNAQDCCAGKIGKCQPWRDRKLSRGFKGKPNILIHFDRLVSPPDQSTTSKGGDEGNSIDELGRTSRHIQLVHEPVKIKKWCGELVEYEIQAIVVHERSLRFCQSISASTWFQASKRNRRNPRIPTRILLLRSPREPPFPSLAHPDPRCHSLNPTENILSKSPESCLSPPCTPTPSASHPSASFRNPCISPTRSQC